MTDRASSASAAPGDAVRAWSDRVVIPTYPTFPPERSPFFLERRVHQGSSGRVYPNPVTDRVSGEKVDRAYLAVHLENAYMTLMILPEYDRRRYDEAIVCWESAAVLDPEFPTSAQPGRLQAVPVTTREEQAGYVVVPAEGTGR